MRQLWPPPPLGFGTPLNLALGRDWKPSLGMAVAAGVATPPLILLVDRLLFAGVSMERVRAFAAQPLADKLQIVAIAGLIEELVFRVVISTLVAWLSYLVIRRQTAAIWLGIAVGAVLFGLAHVANLPPTATTRRGTCTPSPRRRARPHTTMTTTGIASRERLPPASKAEAMMCRTVC